MLNAIARRAEWLGIGGPLSVDTMLAAACRRVQARDFQDESFLTPLRVLVDAINEEAELTPLGRAVQRERLEAHGS